MLNKIKSYCKQEDQGRDNVNLNQDNNSGTGEKLAGKRLRFLDELKMCYWERQLCVACCVERKNTTVKILFLKIESKILL